jgi:hypothetical protein
MANPVFPNRDCKKADDDQIADAGFRFDYQDQQHSRYTEQHIAPDIGSDKMPHSPEAT